MQTEEVKLLYGKFNLPVESPTTIDELVAVLGSVENVIDESVDNVRYRNWYPRIYRKASEKVAAEGFEKVQATNKAGEPATREKTSKNPDGTEKKEKVPVMESDMDHLDRFHDSSEENKTKLEGILTELLSSEPLFVKGERTAGQARVSAAATTAAQQVISQGTDRVAAVVSKINATVPGYRVTVNGDGQPTEESLARGIQALQLHLKREADKQAKAMLAV